MSKSQYKRKILAQRFYGVCIILFCALIVWIASNGTSMEDRDCTAVLFLLPLGIYTLFTKKIVFV